jgi:hypothetical protein
MNGYHLDSGLLLGAGKEGGKVVAFGVEKTRGSSCYSD